MYLLFEITRQGLRYGTFTAEADLIYEGLYPLKEWSAREVQGLFQHELLPKLRAHGKLFAKIGIVVPFADVKQVEPALAQGKLLAQLATTPLRKRLLQPVSFILDASHKAWPHLPQVFLFDTYLSHELTREVALPPFDYDTAHALNVHPLLLHSYGHKANLSKARTKGPVVSLYLGDQTSIAVFEDGKVQDALVSYSPLSSLMGMSSSGTFDPGFYLDASSKKNNNVLLELLTERVGLSPMTETHHDLSTLLQIAGILPRSDGFNPDEYSIETIEWIELSMRNYIRSLRHAIGAMKVWSSEVNTLIVNATELDETSKFWSVLTRNGLHDLRLSFSKKSLLQAACEDLIAHETKSYH